jgi:hypothetical protein
LFKWVNIPPGDKLHPWGPSSPLGTKFTPGDQVHPWGPSSPLGSKFTPRVKLPTWVQTSNLGANFNPGCKLIFFKVPARQEHATMSLPSLFLGPMLWFKKYWQKGVVCSNYC